MQRYNAKQIKFGALSARQERYIEVQYVLNQLCPGRGWIKPEKECWNDNQMDAKVEAVKVEDSKCLV